MVANPEWSIKDAAAQSGRCRKRFAQLLRLSFLAPEIVKRIVEGHPADWIPRDLMEVALPAVGKRSRRCWVSLEGNRPAALRRRVEVSERELRLPSYKDNRLRKNRFGPRAYPQLFWQAAANAPLAREVWTSAWRDGSADSRMYRQQLRSLGLTAALGRPQNPGKRVIISRGIFVVRY